MQDADIPYHLSSESLIECAANPGTLDDELIGPERASYSDGQDLLYIPRGMDNRSAPFPVLFLNHSVEKEKNCLFIKPPRLQPTIISPFAWPRQELTNETHKLYFRMGITR